MNERRYLSLCALQGYVTPIEVYMGKKKTGTSIGIREMVEFAQSKKIKLTKIDAKITRIKEQYCKSLDDFDRLCKKNQPSMSG